MLVQKSRIIFNFLLGSPLSTTSTPSDFIDRFSLPPYNPNNSPKSAEELLKSLVNPIDFDLSEDHYLHPENYPKSGPFFDLHRTKNVTALKGVTTNLICRVRRLGNSTVRKKSMHCTVGKIFRIILPAHCALIP